jgi:hypothetical protein
LAAIKAGKKSDSELVPDFDYNFFGIKEKDPIGTDEFDAICTKEYAV